MEEENNRYKHYHDLLDSLVDIEHKTEEPLSDLNFQREVELDCHLNFDLDF